MSAETYGWIGGLVAAAVVSAVVVIVLLRRRRCGGGVPPAKPSLTLHGPDTATIERVLLGSWQDPAVLHARRLECGPTEGALPRGFGAGWMGRARDAVRRIGEGQLDMSPKLRRHMLREAVLCAGGMVPFSDDRLVVTLAGDVGVASVMHAMACHNLMAWLRGRGNGAAQKAFLAALDAPVVRPATAADMLAARRLTGPLVLLLEQADWLLHCLSFAPPGLERERAAAKEHLGETIQRVLFLLHLHQLEAGDAASVLSSLMRTDSPERVAALWEAHTQVYSTRRATWSGNVTYSYHWSVRVRPGGQALRPLASVVEGLCVGLHRSGGSSLSFQDAVARLIAGNPLDLILRLPVFPWHSLGMSPGRSSSAPVLSWDRMTPLLRAPYWDLHDKLADALAHSLCRLVNGAGNDFERHCLVPFVNQTAQPPADDVDSEVQWGARHLLLCWCEHLVRRNDWGIGLGGEPGSGDVRLVGSVLLGFHVLRMAFDRRRGVRDAGVHEQRYRDRYERFIRSGDEAKMIRLCVEWGGAFHAGGPRSAVTWPPSRTGETTSWQPSRLRAVQRYPLVLESHDWGDPHRNFRELLSGRSGWCYDEENPDTCRLELDEQTKVTLDLETMTFVMEPDRREDAERMKRLEDELWELTFRAQAKCLARAYGLGLYQAPAQAAVTVQGDLDGVLARAEFDWHRRTWWLDRCLMERARCPQPQGEEANHVYGAE